jgi:hypothetical protein
MLVGGKRGRVICRGTTMPDLARVTILRLGGARDKSTNYGDSFSSTSVKASGDMYPTCYTTAT